jgi:membrane protein
MAASGGRKKSAAKKRAAGKPAAKKRPAKKRAAKKSAARPAYTTGKLKPLRSLTWEQWKAVARKSFDRFGEVGLTDRAAALAYYGFLSLFPALIVGVALLALFGNYPETYRSIMDTLRDAAPGEAVNTVDSALKNVLRGRGAEGLLGFGLLFAFVTASGAVGASIRALEAINQTSESATFVRSNLTRIWLTLALMGLLLVAALALLVAGPLFGSIADGAGLGDTGRTVVRMLRYPVGFAALLGALLLLYSLGPAGTRRRLIEHLPGAVLATVLGVLASMAFSFYVDNFGSYDKTYGTLGAVIVLLIWIYVGGVAMLLGALLNRELTRVR